MNALLETALAMPDSEREVWLANLPPDDQPLAQRVAVLLARSAVSTDDFLRQPIGVTWKDLEAVSATAADRAGDPIGPYRLVRELGAGGMATVWLAERFDGVMQRRVALKLPHAGWAPGLAQRMARERDLLGALEHPHIARLYDAGVTPDGRPWMAMEYVLGAPIDVYCREQNLDVTQRVRLVQQVAEAMAHAHARLIVHRDLKPGNILVTPEGQVRLLDFGVATLLDSDATAATHLTQLLGRPLTPDYASPEQVSGGALTVATDVYSLGVVLYELLTRQRPYKLKRASAAALEEAILTAEVPLASSRVAADAALARRLRGDLDAIVAKALRKNPAHRYTSVEALAADLQRHLDGEPVSAQPLSKRYLAVKFIRRHRRVLSAASAVALSLVCGLGVALWQARTARIEAARAEQVKQFIASIFQQAMPRRGAGGVVTAADLLSAAAARIERELASDPRMAAELGFLVGNGFTALGESALSEAPLRAAVARAEQGFGRRHPITVGAKAVLVSAIDRDHIEEAEAMLADLVPDALAGLPATAEGAVLALRMQSFLLAKRNRVEPSYAALRQAIDVGEKHLGPQHWQTIYVIGLLSNTYGRFGEHELQLQTATEAMRRATAAFGSQRPHDRLTPIERWYGSALSDNDRPADAVPILQQVLRDQRALDAGETYRVLNAMLPLAHAQLSAGQVAPAVELLREAVALERRLHPKESYERVDFGTVLAAALTEARLADEALALDNQLIAMRKMNYDAKGDAYKLRQRVRHARILALVGQGEAAARAAAEVAEDARDGHPLLRAQARLVQAMNARLQRRPALALDLARQALAEAGFDTVPLSEQALAHAEAGAALVDLGEFAQAQTALQRSLALYERAQVAPSVRSATALVAMSRVHLQAGRIDEATGLLQPLVIAWEQANPGSAWHGEALHWLAQAQGRAGREAEARASATAAEPLLRGVRIPMLRALSAARPA